MLFFCSFKEVFLIKCEWVALSSFLLFSIYIYVSLSLWLNFIPNSNEAAIFTQFYF